MRIGSLCSGVGLLDLAVMDVLDATVAWHAQYDPDDRHQYAAQILAHHWPDVPNLGDITSIGWAEVEPVDSLTAGFPCQPVSNAGRRKGQDDDRWLWPDVADAVRALRPRLVFLENVSALLVRGFDAVACDLAALGYDFAWTCLRASDVGGAHRRERWFCLAWDADDDFRMRTGGPLVPQEPDPAGDAGRPPAHPEGVGEREPADPQEPFAGGGDAREEPRRGGVLAAADTDDAGAFAEPHRQPERSESHDEHAELDPAGRVLGWGPYGPAIARWERVMGRCAPAPTEPGKNGPRLAPRFVEWLMGAPEGHITDVPGIPRSAQLKAAGNGVVRQQGAAALRLLLDRSPLAALSTRTERPNS